jgi:hypothetical protein
MLQLHAAATHAAACPRAHRTRHTQKNQGARTGEDAAAAKPGRALAGQPSRRRLGAAASGRSMATSDGEGGGVGDDDHEPELSIPQLATGLKEAEIKDLAYLIVAATCR